MNLKAIAILVSACSATLGAHTAIVAYGARVHERLSREQRIVVGDVVREELKPVRDDVARAHARLDVHIQQHAARAQ